MKGIYSVEKMLYGRIVLFTEFPKGFSLVKYQLLLKVGMSWHDAKLLNLLRLRSLRVS